jgi:hypothetical protein
MTNGDHFPNEQAYFGAAYPIFIEPVAGSGERLCIGAISILDGHGHACESIFCWLHAADEALILKLEPLASQALLDIQSHVNSTGSITDFVFSTPGVFLGPCIAGRFKDNAMALRTVFKNHSMFYRSEAS